MNDAASPGTCPDPEDIAVFIQDGDGASASWRRTFEGHVAACAHCRKLLSALARLDTLRSAPRSALASAPSGAPADHHDAWLEAGTQIGRYQVLDRLGDGGMGVVYAAHDPMLGRKVALKLLRGAPDPAAQARLHDRLRREAHAMAQVTHPNVVTVYDVGTWSDRIFIAMEMIEGQTLSQWLAQARRSWREIVAMFLAAGQGLAAAHAAGLVHRDFKPANVFVGRDGRVRVGDFGLATSAAAAAAATVPAVGLCDAVQLGHGSGSHSIAATMLAGTPLFMAPEQLRGARPDARSDQFSFCVALHMAITGEHPFAGEALDEIVSATVDGVLRRPVPTRVPRWLWTVLRRGIATDPMDRYPSMTDLLDALARGGKRWRRAVVIAAGLAVLAVGGVLAMSRLSDDAPGTPRIVSEPVRGVARYDATPLAGAPDLLEAYDREWTAYGTDTCELPARQCMIQATNLLRNADFARAGAAWKPHYGAIDLRWQDGVLRASTAARSGAVVQEVPWSISQGRAYRFTVWVRAASGRAPATGALTLSSTGAQGTNSATTQFTAGPDWAEVSVTVSAEDRGDRFQGEVALDPAGAIEIDNASLVDAGLGDPGFELPHSKAWRPVNFYESVQIASVATDAKDGRHALRVQTSALEGSVAQDTRRVPLAGTTYTFSVWLRASAAGSTVAGRLALWGLRPADEVAITGFRVGHAWTKVETSLFVRNHGHSSFRAEIYLDTLDTPLEVDAASLTPAGLLDASFESSAPGWYAPGTDSPAGEIHRAGHGSLPGGGLGVGQPAAQDGLAWLRVTRAVGGDVDVVLAQDLGAPLRGTTYTFSAWVRAVPGSGAPVSGHVVLDALGDACEQSRTAFTVPDAWTLVTTSLTIPDDQCTGARVAIALDGAGTQLDVDATRLSGAIVTPFASESAAR